MDKITYKDIEVANSKLISTDIKGKPYMEVNQRIKAFRMVYAQGSIPTEIVSMENGVIIMKASVYTDDGRLLATGTAYEKENSTFINKTSYIENCETSAVGRALGLAGFGIDTSIASAEEVANAIQQQDQDKIIDNKLVSSLNEAIENNNIMAEIVEKILSKYGYLSTSEIKVKDYAQIVQDFKKEK